MNLVIKFLLFPIGFLSFVLGCDPGPEDTGSVKNKATLLAVATTGLVADAVGSVGGNRVEVVGLMGPGIDPHLYKAKARDVQKMTEADVIFYNGLHLEGKLSDILDQMRQRGIRTVAVTDGINPAQLLTVQEFEGNFDPHIWFDVSLWMEAVEWIRDRLTEFDPDHGDSYRENARAYLSELAVLHDYVKSQAEKIPKTQRILITAHDAFNYFGRAYDFEVQGLQGITTASEAGTADVQQLSRFIFENRIPAVFVESSVPLRSIEAVQAAVKARGFEVRIGGQLYSDALGDPTTHAADYLGMVRYNIDTITKALSGAGN